MRIISFFIILFLSTFVFAQNNNSSVYTEDKLGVMVMPEHPNFTIRLKSNPTTGYSWFLREYSNNLLEPTKHVFEGPKDTKLIGAPGYEVWTFHVKPSSFTVPQQTVIRFVYARPWESNDQSKQLVFRVSLLTSASVPSTSHSQKSTP